MRERQLAIITGGSRGIGHHVVQFLLQDMDVLNISRTPARKADTETEGNLFNLSLDLSDTSATCESIASWLTAHPSYCVTTLISNAAVLNLGWLSEDSVILEKLPQAFQINVQAPLAISSRLFQSGVFCEDEARIIYVTSSLARPLAELSFAGLGLYSATKAALGRLAQIQAREFALTAPHIRVVQAHPGIVDTDMQRDLRHSKTLDQAFADKTAGLPHYQEGDWLNRSPLDNMRTISANFAAEFLVWITGQLPTALEDEYDFYTTAAFHESREVRT